MLNQKKNLLKSKNNSRVYRDSQKLPLLYDKAFRDAIFCNYIICYSLLLEVQLLFPTLIKVIL